MWVLVFALGQGLMAVLFYTWRARVLKSLDRALHAGSQAGTVCRGWCACEARRSGVRA